MSQPPAPPRPPAEPCWDITFTRLSKSLLPQIESCARELVRRFQAVGLGCDVQVRQMPRGVSTFLALIGRRGLICIIDLTLVDGMAAGLGHSATLEFRLLDACGDVVADGLAGSEHGRNLHADAPTEAFMSAQMERAATLVYVCALAHFDVLQPGVPHA